MRRAVVLFALLLLLAGPVTGDFHQLGVDVARTGGIEGEGPRFNETAFSLSLPGGLAGQPLILDRNAYVLTNHIGEEGRDEHGLWRIGLDDAQVERLVDIEPKDVVPCYPWDASEYSNSTTKTSNCYLSDLASDGDRFYVARSGGIDVYDLDGDAVDSWDDPLHRPETDNSYCPRGLALTGDTLYLQCVRGKDDREATGGTDVAGEGGLAYQGYLVIYALDLPDLEERWRWERNLVDEKAPEGMDENPLRECDVAAWEACPRSITPQSVGAAVIGDVLIATTIDMIEAETDPTDPGSAMPHYWGLRSDDGTFLWKEAAGSGTQLQAIDPARPTPSAPFVFFGGPPTGGDGVAFLKVERELRAVNPLRNEIIWRETIGSRDPEVGNQGSGMALAGDDLFVSSFQTLYRIDVAERRVLWNTTMDPRTDQAWAWGGLLASPRTVYGISSDGTTATALHMLRALDAADGSLLWNHPFRIDPPIVEGAYDRRFQVAMADGVAVVADLGGGLTVLGRTGASPTPRASASDIYPGPGEAVTVDLTGSMAGRLGEPTRYRADWGDGNATPWQDDPQLSHAYTTSGAHEAVLWVGNEEGQTAATTLTFDVGGSPPDFWDRLRPEHPLLLLLVIGTLGIAMIASTKVIVSRRARRHQDPLGTYREVLALEVSAGTPREETLQRLAPIRARLGVSLRQHEHLELQLREGEGSLRPGDLFLGRYRVERLLGAGTGGTTYLTSDRELDRQVVLKVVPLTAGKKDGYMDEAQAFARIHDPNVLTIYDIEKVGAMAYLVLEYAPEGTLSDELEAGPLSSDSFARLVHDLLDGLAAIHTAELVHRDVKPSNILRASTGRYKLGDLGASGVTREVDQADEALDGTMIQRPNAAVGTVPYMSPEQAQGDPPGIRSDLYAAALVLFEAHTGSSYVRTRPGETRADLQARVAKARGPRVDRVDPSLRKWFRQALALRPEDRFPDAATMKAAFEKTTTG